MSTSTPQSVMSELRERIARLESGSARSRAALPFDLARIDKVELADRLQGFMLVKKGGNGNFSRHQDHPKADLIYVDRLAVAPWNRPRFMREPIYKGIGRLLVATAVNLSFEEELDGRVGLHSLPGAEGFYRDVLRMTDFGPDADYGMDYFEFSSAQAKVFLNPLEGDGA